MLPLETDGDAMARAVEDFRHAMQLRRAITLRVAKRVTALLRIGIFSVAFFAILLTVIIWIFTDRTQDMTAVLGTMQEQFAGMADNMDSMRTSLARIENDMAAFTIVSHEMNGMRATIAAIDDEVGRMGAQVGLIRQHVTLVGGHTVNMAQSFRLLTPAVSSIGARVAKGSEPSKTFNRVFPSPWRWP
jgi:hypothetical protein